MRFTILLDKLLIATFTISFVAAIALLIPAVIYGGTISQACSISGAVFVASLSFWYALNKLYLEATFPHYTKH